MKSLGIYELTRAIDKDKSLKFCIQMFPTIAEKKNREITISK